MNNIDLEELIAMPLISCARTQKMLADSTRDFIKEVGLNEDESLNILTFSYTLGNETKNIKVPILTIVNIPSLSIKKININFEMTVNSISQVSNKRKYKGALTSRGNSSVAKYDISICGEDTGPTEALNKVLNVLEKCIDEELVTSSNN